MFHYLTLTTSTPTNPVATFITIATTAAATIIFTFTFTTTTTTTTTTKTSTYIYIYIHIVDSCFLSSPLLDFCTAVFLMLKFFVDALGVFFLLDAHFFSPILTLVQLPRQQQATDISA